jgi:hypothetical protein
MNHLTEAEVQTAQAWASRIDGCTCRTEFDGMRYVVERHTCDHCREWDRKLTELGIGAKPMRPVEQKRRRKAA